MKVYNITNTQKFFELLSSCEGTVEIVNAQGMHISMRGDTAANSLSHMAPAKDTISELELCFSCPRDTLRVLNFVM